MGRYRNTVSMPGSGIETPKDLKKRIKQREMILEDFIEMTRIIDMPWEARQQTVGNLYMDIRDMKNKLKGK